MIWENIKMALISLRSAKMRSFLTMLGIIIGIASVVSIGAIGEGVKKSVVDEISGIGANVISVTPGQPIKTDKNGKKSFGNPSSSIGASTLTQQDVDSIGTLPSVSAVAPLMLISGQLEKDGTIASDALIAATTPNLLTVASTLKVDKGRFIDDEHKETNEITLGSKVKEELFGTNEAAGQTVTLRGTPFTVVGVMKSADSGASSLSGGGGYDTMVFLSIDAAKRITGGNVQILRMLVQAKPNQVNQAVDQIKTVMLKNHGGAEDFSVLTQADLISTVDTILSLLSTFIAAIASIALLVGGIGIMNMMLVSVTERTREIGIRKALGATRLVLLTQFLIEAVILSLMGGLLGVVAAYGQATVAGKLAKITPVFTPQNLLTAFGVSVAIGIIFGLAPAIKAARKRPIEALRYE